MDNFLPSNSVQEQHSMDLNNNHSRFSTFPTYDHHQAQPHHLLPPYNSYVACPVDETAAMNPQIPVIQTGSEFGYVVCNPGLRQAGGGFLDPHPAKMARINRKKAMIRSRNNSSPNSSSSELVDSRRQVVFTMKKMPRLTLEMISIDFPHSITRVLLVKHLKNSDVGSLGRIILPKREAERNLPELSNKEGMIVEMRDADFMQHWSFKYKFWSNNKSRMYVLENTGEFVTKKGVEMGDFLTIYEDESKNLYFSVRKYADKPIEGREDESMEVNDINFYEDMTFDFIQKDEEEDSIAMLIGNLNDHYPNPNDLMDIPIDLDQATSSMPPVDYMTNTQHVGSSNDHMSFNDFVW